jgi:hypothetical protein
MHPLHVVGQEPASAATQTGALAPGTLQQIFHGGQHAAPQQTWSVGQPSPTTPQGGSTQAP